MHFLRYVLAIYNIKFHNPVINRLKTNEMYLLLGLYVTLLYCLVRNLMFANISGILRNSDMLFSFSVAPSLLKIIFIAFTVYLKIWTNKTVRKNYGFWMENISVQFVPVFYLTCDKIGRYH